mmetsp:Transcript_10303/g.22991  ORF Transcript_10303/g.22991 Transcript_10303/m.22991 type:complete len:230 (-) Transcript_10303:3446-4135(-)
MRLIGGIEEVRAREEFREQLQNLHHVLHVDAEIPPNDVSDPCHHSLWWGPWQRLEAAGEGRDVERKLAHEGGPLCLLTEVDRSRLMWSASVAGAPDPEAAGVLDRGDRSRVEGRDVHVEHQLRPRLSHVVYPVPVEIAADSFPLPVGMERDRDDLVDDRVHAHVRHQPRLADGVFSRGAEREGVDRRIVVLHQRPHLPAVIAFADQVQAPPARARIRLREEPGLGVVAR